MKQAMNRVVVFRILVTAVVLMSSFSLSAQDGLGLVRIGVYQNPPKITVSPEGGWPGGLHGEILTLFDQYLDWNPVFISGEWNELLDLLEAREIDMLVDVARSDEREEKYFFNGESVLVNWGVVYSRPENPIRSFYDLEGLRVASMDESVHTDSSAGIRSLLEQFSIDASIILTPDYEEAFALVADGQADAAVANRLFGITRAAEYDLVRTDVNFNPRSIYYAFPRHPDSAALIREIDDVLSMLKRDRSSRFFEIIDSYAMGPVATREVTPPWLAPLLLSALVIIGGYSVLTAIVIREVGQRRRSEKNLRAYQDRLIYMAKHEYLNTLVADLGHQLNTPLGVLTTAVSGAQDLLAPAKVPPAGDAPAVSPANKEVGEYLELARDSVERMNRIVGAFRELSDQDAKDSAAPGELTEIVEAIILLHRQTLEAAGIQLEINLEPGLSWQVERRPLLTVLNQMVTNSTEHGGPGMNRIKIDMTSVVGDGSSRRQATRVLRIRYRDNGLGVPPELSGRLFLPFSSMSRNGEHLGLGLHIAQLLVHRRLGGEIRYIQCDSGCEFLITIDPGLKT